GKVLKDDKGKVFVLKYSGKEKVVGRRESCQKREEEEKVIERSKGSWGKGSLLGEGRVVGRREDYREGYYQRGCNCQK
ncbi:1778_t:CDS:2, partial [Gigaspora margarita]